MNDNTRIFIKIENEILKNIEYNKEFWERIKEEFKNKNIKISENEIVNYINARLLDDNDDNLKDKNNKDDKDNIMFEKLTQIYIILGYICYDVMFVTASTGLGKSTKLPYLISHISKIDNSNIYITGPRINAVQNTFSNVAKYIDTNNKNKDDILTNYKSKKEDEKEWSIKHEGRGAGISVSTTNNPTTFTSLTDGLLLNKITNIVKKKKNDIFILDEIHEHNSNVDQLCTIINYLPHNKLYLLTATLTPKEKNQYVEIDDYKRIAGNRKVGLLNIKNPSEKNSDTRYKINEKYEGNIRYPFKKIYNNAIEKTISLARRDVFRNNNNSEGERNDILLFVDTKRHVYDACKKITRKIGKNVLCVPYHRNQNNSQNKIINIIQKNNNEKISRIHDDFKGEKSNGEKKFYRSIIVVSTAIAEASITLPQLTYVVDTGYNMSTIYNLELGAQEIRNKLITKNSSDQRRGRVGRVKEGTIYYMYMSNPQEKGVLSPMDYEIQNNNKVEETYWDFKNKYNLGTDFKSDNIESYYIAPFTSKKNLEIIKNRLPDNLIKTTQIQEDKYYFLEISIWGKYITKKYNNIFNTRFKILLLLYEKVIDCKLFYKREDDFIGSIYGFLGDIYNIYYYYYTDDDKLNMSKIDKEDDFKYLKQFKNSGRTAIKKEIPNRYTMIQDINILKEKIKEYPFKIKLDTKTYDMKINNYICITKEIILGNDDNNLELTYKQLGSLTTDKNNRNMVYIKNVI